MPYLLVFEGRKIDYQRNKSGGTLLEYGTKTNDSNNRNFLIHSFLLYVSFLA